MDEIYLGYAWNPETGGKVTFDLSSHMAACSPTGSSKGVSLEIPNLALGLRNSSVVNPDPSGQNAAVCAAARAAMGHRLAPINPMGLHVKQYADLQSVGFNPLLTLDPDKPAQFFIRAVAIAEATVPKEEGANSKFFYEGARDLGACLIMFNRLRDGDDANLATCRDMLTEAEFTDADGKVTSGIRFWASEAVADGSGPDASAAARRVASMAGRFMLESRANRDIIATLITAWRWLEDERIRADLSVKNGFNPATLRDHQTYVPVILPAGTEQEFFSGWLRMVISCTMDVLYERGSDGKPGVPTIFMLSEAAQYGHMTPFLAALGQGRKYGIRLAPMVYQNYGQIRDGGHGDNGADTIIGNSGCIFGFSPGNSAMSADFLSKLSGQHLVIGQSASDDLQQGVRPSYSLQREWVWSPERIRSLPERHALVWKAGQSEPIPVYCPPYWDIKACRRVCRPDPYHPNSTVGGAIAKFAGRRFGKAVKIVTAAVVLLALAAFALPQPPPMLHHPGKPVPMVHPPKAHHH
jgi:type IV secretory pathway TraG/TraD family ATPase VirD4